MPASVIEIGLEVNGEHDDGHAGGAGVSDLHANPVVRARTVQDGDHGAEAFAVKLEQAAPLDLGDEVLLVGAAERQEGTIGTDLRGKPVGEAGGESTVVRGEEPMGYGERHRERPPSR
ncbi:hypothetical protein OHA98_16220 [Streptomyces sp. NBC_00654]|uniref:hypothetical protein n=1 Tax=Streptomyces sp. NBC_00654 TaxID=2975799 RepID=UPI0022555379|nr:hypothetical protein [Streptomyces sp. NBC_00654]MCX4966354.1 hypothetical protein [Streptomyces sp. NBC_00654]